MDKLIDGLPLGAYVYQVLRKQYWTWTLETAYKSKGLQVKSLVSIRRWYVKWQSSYRLVKTESRYCSYKASYSR